MIFQEPEQVVRKLQENWLGREVRVTKTEPSPPLQFTLGEARMLGWDEVAEPVRTRVPEETRFMALSGKGDQLYTVFIPVDEETVYDVRENRLVMLTGEEVVQVNPVG
ncbi:MAG: hypothetical protein IBX71_00590 [Candidatus Desulforudis sp.]|nr:hypothetical protein [Desulforudis sp.]